MASSSVRVEKATSDLLIGPDWTMNMEICDSINSDHWQAKDVVKILKKRLQHKNPKVQFLALTLLETMIKNCGDYVHQQVAERNILQELVKIVKKKTDMQVRDKILILLDSWQEAFGGPNGKYPQYYWAYQELRVFGVQFPQRSPDAAPIFTPPVTHHPVGNLVGHGMPNNATQRLDEAMASEVESLSLTNLDSFRHVMELLADMLHAVDPNDREAVKDEVIVDLVSQCQFNQKKLMQMLSSTGDEELLGQGLELNDNLQSLLAKHVAIASGSPLSLDLKNVGSGSRPHTPATPVSSKLLTRALPSDAQENGTIVPVIVASDLLEEDDEEDEFAQLARRPSKANSVPSESSLTNHDQVGRTIDSVSDLNKALALPDPPIPVRTSAEKQDIIDLLSITLSTNTPSPPHTPLTLPPANKTEHPVPHSTVAEEYPGNSLSYPVSQAQVAYNSYVAPWARPAQLPQSQFQTQPQPQSQPQPQPQMQPSSHFQALHHPQLQSQPGYSQNLTRYPPPPWAVTPTPGYNLAPPNAHFSPLSSSSSTYTGNAPTAAQFNSFEARGNNIAASNFGEGKLSPRLGPALSSSSISPMLQFNTSNSRYSSSSAHREMGGSTKARPAGSEQKPFIPSYRLFEDLIDVRNLDGQKTGSGTSANLSGSSGQSMLGSGKK